MYVCLLRASVTIRWLSSYPFHGTVSDFNRINLRLTFARAQLHIYKYTLLLQLTSLPPIAPFHRTVVPLFASGIYKNYQYYYCEQLENICAPRC